MSSDGRMSVNVKLFGTLRRYVPGHDPEKGIEVELDGKASVHALLVMLGVPEDEARTILVKGLPKELTDILQDGDQVSIFLPVFGG
jgi:molybdopterin converting factor small subunit